MSDSIPGEIGKYLSDDDSFVHSHKSTILNLACGQTIMKPLARDRLTKGYVCHHRWPTQILTVCRHCADAVISFAIPSTLVARLAATLVDCAARWIQSRSDYDAIFAALISPAWATVNKPVVSRRGQGHKVYVGYDIRHPDGKLPQCPSQCNLPLGHHVNTHAIRLVCPKCHAKTNVEKVLPTSKTALGRQKLVKADFPFTLPVCPWEIPVTSAKSRPQSQVPQFRVPADPATTITRSISLPTPPAPIRRAPAQSTSVQMSHPPTPIIAAPAPKQGGSPSFGAEEVEEDDGYSPVRYRTHSGASKRRRKQ